MQEIERILSGKYDGTALAQFLEDAFGDVGRQVGMLVSSTALVATAIVLVNYLMGSMLPEVFVAGLAVLVGLYAAVETSVDAVTGEDIEEDTASWHFTIVVMIFTAFAGLLLRDLWMALPPGTNPLFFAWVTLLFAVWARADF